MKLHIIIIIDFLFLSSLLYSFIAAANNSHNDKNVQLRRRQEQGKNKKTQQRNVQQQDDDDTFTVIFISDLENRYRGHTVYRSRYILQYISEIANENIYYDDEIHKTNKPKLVIHGGDISHYWACESFWGCQSIEREYIEVWDILYNASIPMISSFGNHDWAQAIGTGNDNNGWGPNVDSRQRNEPVDMYGTKTSDDITKQSIEFVTKSYEKSKPFGITLHETFQPVGEFGQSMYRATIDDNDIQIAHINCAINWESYDDNGVYSSEEQLDSLFESLDRNMTTLFITHYPIRNIRSQSIQNKIKNLIYQFPKVAVFSGHVHVEGRKLYTMSNSELESELSFIDYTAPYPHTWNNIEEPGFFAILISPTKGIIEVKTIRILGYSDGRICVLSDCGKCNIGYHKVWSRYKMQACGNEPCIKSDDLCLTFDLSLGPSCSNCCNKEKNCPWYFFGLLCRCSGSSVPDESA